MLSWPLYFQNVSKTVDGRRRRFDQRVKASVPGLGCCGAVCSAVERL